jgi:LmbE family N-acetylglucosaminyl deacetylase
MWSEKIAATRTVLRAANALGSRGIEAIWGSAIPAVGTVLALPLRQWSSDGQDRVLVVAAHSDDDAMGCAGTLIRHRCCGDSVRIAIVTDGARSRALGFDAQAIVAHRRRESEEAARRMDVESQWIGLREGDWTDHEGMDALQRILEEVKPTVIYTPSAIDYQAEHRRVAALVAAVVTKVTSSAEIRIYAVQVPLTSLLVNLVHDVSDLEAPIRRVLSSYATQRQSVSRTFRLRRYAARVYGATGEVEAFCTMTTSLYATLHKRPLANFRGLYIRAWTDPAAIMVGIRERISWHHLLRQAEGSPGMRPALRFWRMWR